MSVEQHTLNRYKTSEQTGLSSSDHPLYHTPAPRFFLSNSWSARAIRKSTSQAKLPLLSALQQELIVPTLIINFFNYIFLSTFWQVLSLYVNMFLCALTVA